MRTTLAILLLLLSLIAAGCIDNPPASAATAPGQAAMATLEASEDGAINVLVTDDSFAPIAGAGVGILESSLQATTDAAGRVRLSGLPAGLYTVAAQQLGFSSATRRVDLAAGDTVDVAFQLTPITIIDAYHETYIFEGFITCGAGLIQVRLITVCGRTGTGTPAGDVNVDPNHKDEYKHPVQPGIVGLVGELVWTSTAPLSAKEFTLDLYKGWICVPFCEWDEEYGGETGASPVVTRIDEPLEGIDKPDTEVSFVVGVPGQSDEPPFVIFIIQQEYTIYSTHFYGEAPPEDFVARPDA